jgi:hypothetical protein
MTAAKLFDKGTMRIVDADGTVLWQHVRVIARVDGVELYALARDYPDGEPVAGTRGVVRVATIASANVVTVGTQRWQLHDGHTVYTMTRDGRCSTCSGNPLGAARL